MPPNLPIMYGNLQMFPSPTATPIMVMTIARRDVNVSRSMFGISGMGGFYAPHAVPQDRCGMWLHHARRSRLQCMGTAVMKSTGSARWPGGPTAVRLCCAMLLAVLAAQGCARVRPNLAVAAPPSTGDATLDYLRTRELMVPVDGLRVEQVPDNFSAGRGGRPHNAHDFMAARGTAVLSADDGRIIRLSNNALGGITIYATDPAEKLVYYYAHMDRYASGLKAGMRVSKGELLGYVGSTGNASPAAPHLHFQVARLDDISRHWEGEPIDARPWFALDGRKK